MARIRSIKPEMPSDEALARLSRDARLTFVYLITQADDDGLQFGTARQLLGTLFPHNDDVTESMLMTWCNELASIGAVRWRKTRHGAPVLELTNWERHQHIKNRKHPVIAPMLVPLEDVPSSSGEPTEDLRTSSSTNQSTSQPRTVDHSTLDLGSANQPTAGTPFPASREDCCRWLAMAANKGLEERYGFRHRPILPIAKGTSLAFDELRDKGVDQQFAEAAIYAYAKDMQLEKPPRSLGYFTDHVIDEWQAAQARRDSADYHAPSREQSFPEVDAFQEDAIVFARQDKPGWRDYCREHHIVWEKAS